MLSQIKKNIEQLMQCYCTIDVICEPHLIFQFTLKSPYNAIELKVGLRFFFITQGAQYYEKHRN